MYGLNIIIQCKHYDRITSVNFWGYVFAHAGKLNVGDQILVCDGISLINITHEEAGHIFKRAMDMESVSGHTLEQIKKKLLNHLQLDFNGCYGLHNGVHKHTLQTT